MIDDLDTQARTTTSQARREDAGMSGLDRDAADGPDDQARTPAAERLRRLEAFSAG